MPVLSVQMADTEPSVSHRWQPFDDGVLGRKLPRTHGIHGGDYGRQAGGDGRDSQRHSGDEDGIQLLPIVDPQYDHQDEG